MAQILDGKAHAARMLEEVKQAVDALAQGPELRPPCLAVVLVGEDPASQVYVKGKVTDCAKTGIRSLEYRPPGRGKSDRAGGPHR